MARVRPHPDGEGLTFDGCIDHPGIVLRYSRSRYARTDDTGVSQSPEIESMLPFEPEPHMLTENLGRSVEKVGPLQRAVIDHPAFDIHPERRHGTGENHPR